jgi:hypothetical protein
VVSGRLARIANSCWRSVELAINLVYQNTYETPYNTKILFMKKE